MSTLILFPNPFKYDIMYCSFTFMGQCSDLECPGHLRQLGNGEKYPFLPSFSMRVQPFELKIYLDVECPARQCALVEFACHPHTT